ncbi:MAG TPA: hypothetical protein VEI07_12455 [Planctomycetaceae bacterium]|nr:hypothetical protein [Planctomycetaceae bacterium]
MLAKLTEVSHDHLPEVEAHRIGKSDDCLRMGDDRVASVDLSGT